MNFNNRLYQLRKQRGFSQEELANRLNVSRQTVSKWEVGDSTPDMEKLAAMSELFGVSLDQLVLGKDEQPRSAGNTPEPMRVLSEKVLTPDNRKKAISVLKVLGLIAAGVIAIDVISMIVWFTLYGAPA